MNMFEVDYYIKLIKEYDRLKTDLQSTEHSLSSGLKYEKMTVVGREIADLSIYILPFINKKKGEFSND